LVSLLCNVGEQKTVKIGKPPWGSAAQEPVVYAEKKEHVPLVVSEQNLEKEI